MTFVWSLTLYEIAKGFRVVIKGAGRTVQGEGRTAQEAHRAAEYQLVIKPWVVADRAAQEACHECGGDKISRQSEAAFNAKKPCHSCSSPAPCICRSAATIQARPDCPVHGMRQETEV